MLTVLTSLPRAVHVAAPMHGSVRPFVPADRGRFEAIAREHETFLLRVALRLCREPSDAKDLVQDTLARAFERFSQLQPDTHTRAWLTTILKNHFVDRCRSKGRERRE